MGVSVSPCLGIGMGKRKTSYLFRKNRKQLLSEDGASCAACGNSKRELQCDHVVPVADGGSDELDNLQLLCVKCHKKKTAKEHEKPELEHAARMRALKSKKGRGWWRYRRK